MNVMGKSFIQFMSIKADEIPYDKLTAKLKIAWFTSTRDYAITAIQAFDNLLGKVHVKFQDKTQ